MLAPQVSWATFSLRPESIEATPNYFGIGPGILLGYSMAQKLDLAVYANYTPGATYLASLGKENASLVFGGAHVGLRIKDSVYVGLKGGKGAYHLVNGSLAKGEVPGKWEGSSGGLTIGAIFRKDKRFCWELHFDYMHLIMQRTTPKYPESMTKHPYRRIDFIALTATFTFNGFINSKIENSLFRDILN